MARRSTDVDWFKCDGCEHVLTRPRGDSRPSDATGESTFVDESDPAPLT
jgi:hypothetical protein